jgi:hypothetical protein
MMTRQRARKCDALNVSLLQAQAQQREQPLNERVLIDFTKMFVSTKHSCPL